MESNNIPPPGSAPDPHLRATELRRSFRLGKSDIDVLRTAAQRGIPPPSYHTREERLTSIHENSDIPDEHLVLLLHSSRDLTDAVHSITLQWCLYHVNPRGALPENEEREFGFAEKL